MNEQIEALLNEIRLFGLKESFDYRLSQAMEDNLTLQDFSVLILEDELQYRKNKRFELLRKRAKFREQVFLEDFKTSPKRGITKSMVQQFKTLGFIENKENLVFIGGTGAGKSFLSQAIGQAACAGGVETFFISVNKLFKEVEAAEVSGNYLNYVRRIMKFKLLILDDFGLRNYSHAEANILYDLLEDRYQKGPVIITSQVKPQGWRSLFEDEVIAEAILDRLTSCAHIVDVKGDSYRPNHAPKEKLKLDE